MMTTYFVVLENLFGKPPSSITSDKSLYITQMDYLTELLN